MRKIALIVVLFATSFNIFAQEKITLPAPDKSVSVSLFDALQNRHSSRDFADTPISDEMLSQVLWAANGVNRPDGRLTAPTANNTQDINIYVCSAKGGYFYNAKENTLTKVTDQDIRKDIAGMQVVVANAPIFLVVTSDINKIRSRSEVVGNLDAGYVSQNINLVCSALNLNTVPRLIMNKDAVAKGLNLKEGEIVVVNHPIGFPKK